MCAIQCVFGQPELARELKFSDVQIDRIRNDNPNSLQDQSHALIKLWKEREDKNASGEHTEHVFSIQLNAQHCDEISNSYY